MESADDVTIPQYNSPSTSIMVTVEILGIVYMYPYELDTDPEYIGKAVANTIRKAPKSLRYE